MPNTPEPSSTIIPSHLATVTGGTVKQAPPCHPPPPCHTGHPAPGQPATHCRWPFGDWGHGGPTFNFPTYPWWNNGHPIETAAGSSNKPTR